MNQPTIIRNAELAAVLAELQRASACLIRIEELLNKPMLSPLPPPDWDCFKGGVPRDPSKRWWQW